MDLLQTILHAQGGQAVNQLGSQFGLGQDQTVDAMKALLPALATGVQRNTTQPGGLESLMAALASGGHQQYLDNPSTIADERAVRDGNGILGHMLGSKDVSRQVAAQAAARTGISADVLKKMLPLLASLAMGALSSRASQNMSPGVQPDGPAGTGRAGGGLLDMLGPLLDRDGDESMADDVLGRIGNAFRR